MDKIELITTIKGQVSTYTINLPGKTEEEVVDLLSMLGKKIWLAAK